MNNLEKLITDLSNYWDISPEQVVDRLNFMNEQEINKIVDKMTKKFKNGGLLPKAKFANGGVMKCLKGGKTYSECMKCGGKPIVKNQEPAGPIKIEPEIEPSGFFRRMFWKPTEHPRVDSYDKFDGDFTGTRSSYYTHDGDLMQILTKKFPAGNTAKTELLIKNPHTPMADSTMTIINGNGIDKIRNMRKAKQFLPAFKKNF